MGDFTISQSDAAIIYRHPGWVQVHVWKRNPVKAWEWINRHRKEYPGLELIARHREAGSVLYARSRAFSYDEASGGA